MSHINTSGIEIERKFLLDRFPDNLPLLEESLCGRGICVQIR